MALIQEYITLSYSDKSLEINIDAHLQSREIPSNVSLQWLFLSLGYWMAQNKWLPELAGCIQLYNWFGGLKDVQKTNFKLPATNR